MLELDTIICVPIDWKVIQLINWGLLSLSSASLRIIISVNLFTFAIFWRRTGKHRQEKRKNWCNYGHTTGCCSVFDKSVYRNDIGSWLLNEIFRYCLPKMMVEYGVCYGPEKENLFWKKEKLIVNCLLTNVLDQWVAHGIHWEKVWLMWFYICHKL